MMKQFLLVTFLFPISLVAEGWNLTGGVGSWSTSSSGTITETVNATVNITDHLNDEHYENYYFVELKHSVPLLPNVRVEYTRVQSSGERAEVTVGSSGFLSIPSGSFSKQSTLSMEQYDTLLYYSPLKSVPFVYVDLGLDIKYLRTEYQVESYLDDTSTTVVPLLYLRSGLELPFGVGGDVDLRYITDGTSTVYDLSAKVRYAMTFVPVIKPGLEVGYRQQKYVTDSGSTALIGPILSGETTTDIGFSGVFVGLTARF